jgi:hypothetical protein
MLEWQAVTRRVGLGAAQHGALEQAVHVAVAGRPGNYFAQQRPARALVVPRLLSGMPARLEGRGTDRGDLLVPRCASVHPTHHAESSGVGKQVPNGDLAFPSATLRIRNGVDELWNYVVYGCVQMQQPAVHQLARGYGEHWFARGEPRHQSRVRHCHARGGLPDGELVVIAAAAGAHLCSLVMTGPNAGGDGYSGTLQHEQGYCLAWRHLSRYNSDLARPMYRVAVLFAPANLRAVADAVAESFPKRKYAATATAMSEADVSYINAADVVVLVAAAEANGSPGKAFAETQRALHGMNLAGRMAGLVAVGAERTARSAAAALRQGLDDSEATPPSSDCLLETADQTAAARRWAKSVAGEFVELKRNWLG